MYSHLNAYLWIISLATHPEPEAVSDSLAVGAMLGAIIGVKSFRRCCGLV